MAVDLPKPVAAYFRADGADGNAVADCFAENAVVKDERHTYRGRKAIGHWKAAATAKYRYTSDPRTCEQKDGKTVVVSRLTGDFPGSPIELRYVFELAGDKIASLEIVP